MFLDLSRLFAPYTRPGAGAPPTWKPCQNARAAFAHIAAIGDGGRSVGPRQTHGWRSPQSRGVSESGGIDPPIRPRSDEVSREQTRVDAASRRLTKPESFPVLTASMGDGPRLGQLGGPIPTLRMQRPHPSDRAKHALTGGNALNVSHHSVWFLSVSRTRRARSPIPPHPQRRPIRCPARPSGIPTRIVNPTDTSRATVAQTQALRRPNQYRTLEPMPLAAAADMGGHLWVCPGASLD